MCGPVVSGYRLRLYDVGETEKTVRCCGPQSIAKDMCAQENKTVTGRIKWFDPAKGFGFVVTDDESPDILLHANVLRNFGQGSVAEAATLTIVTQSTDRGLQAIEVLEIIPPETDSVGTLGDMEEFTPEDIARHPVVPARVKWFDKGKGFGFANAFGDKRDVFVHIEVLRRSGLADLATGEAIGMRMMEGKRGLMAIDIVGWDLAAT